MCDSTTQEWFFGSLAAVDNIPMDGLKSEICYPGFEQEMLNDIMGMYDVQGYITNVSGWKLALKLQNEIGHKIIKY
mgnify:CR=1 FL=1